MGSFWDDDDRPTLGLDEEDRRQASEEENLLRAAFEENRRRVDDVFDVYRDVVARYLKYAEAMEDGKEKEDLKKSLWQLRYRLMQGPVRLLVLGASSAGKSTIVNALAGRVVSPEADQVSTLIPAWVKGVDSTGINQPVCYVLSFGNSEELERTRSQYLQDFCHPPEDRNSKPGGQQYAGEESYFAVRVEIQDSFLTRSGITLLDTPGTGQTDTESRMAVETAELGAELLLLVTRKNTLGTGEPNLFRRLICDEQHGLGLCPPKDVFCLFNEGKLNLGEYNTNAKDAFKDLTSGCDREDQLDLKNRYYTIDMLIERRKREAYLFLDWSPKGSRMGSFQVQQEAQDKELGEHEKLAGEPPSPEMQRLLDDLRHRVWDIYADPERILGPIERRLQEAAQVLLNDCLRDIQKEKQQVAEEVRETPIDQLTDPKLAVLLGEMAELESSANYVVKQAQSLAEACKSLLQDIDNTVNALFVRSTELVGKFTENLPDEIPTDAEHMDKEQHGEIMALVYDWFIKHQEEWQRRITGQELITQVPDSVDLDGIGERLWMILRTFNSIAEEAGKYEKTGAAYNVDVETRTWAKKFKQNVADCLTPKDTIKDRAAQLRDYIHELLTDYRTKWLSAANTVFSKTKRTWLRITYAGGIRTSSRDRLNTALTEDLMAYHECLCKEKARLDGWFAPLRHKVTLFTMSIGTARNALKEQIEAREKFCRDEMYKQLMEECVTPLEGAAANFREFIDFLNERRGERA